MQMKHYLIRIDDNEEYEDHQWWIDKIFHDKAKAIAFCEEYAKQHKYNKKEIEDIWRPAEKYYSESIEIIEMESDD